MQGEYLRMSSKERERLVVVREITNTESKQVTHQGQKSPENSQNNDPKNALNEIEIR
jgi:hypothetical protein